MRPRCSALLFVAIVVGWAAFGVALLYLAGCSTPSTQVERPVLRVAPLMSLDAVGTSTSACTPRACGLYRDAAYKWRDLAQTSMVLVDVCKDRQASERGEYAVSLAELEDELRTTQEDDSRSEWIAVGALGVGLVLGGGASILILQAVQ